MKGLVEKVISAVHDFAVKTVSAVIERLHLRDFYEKRPVWFGLSAAVFLLVLVISSVLLLIPKEEPHKRVSVLNPDITQPFVLPQEPVMNDDYYLSRPKTDVWTKEEADRWFTIPDDSMINQLEHDNDKIIKNLLEASP